MTDCLASAPPEIRGALAMMWQEGNLLTSFTWFSLRQFVRRDRSSLIFPQCQRTSETSLQTPESSAEEKSLTRNFTVGCGPLLESCWDSSPA